VSRGPLPCAATSPCNRLGARRYVALDRCLQLRASATQAIKSAHTGTEVISSTCCPRIQSQSRLLIVVHQNLLHTKKLPLLTNTPVQLQLDNGSGFAGTGIHYRLSGLPFCSCLCCS
jgi:hypothetical protein